MPINEKYINKFNDLWDKKCNKYPRLPSVLPATRRIIVIGDIHGDFDELIRCLDRADLVDSSNNWIGNDTIVVQCGDQIDSCRSNETVNCHMEKQDDDKAEDIKILRYLTNLHNQASKFGGAVYSLIGNHEMMNSYDLRYVSYENIVSFADDNSHNKFISGLENRKKQFTPGNKLAEFLACTRLMALVIGSNLFVHAGLVKKISEKYSISDLNMILSLYLFNELDEQEYISDIFENPKISPLWTRVFGLAKKNMGKKKCAELMDPLMENYQVGKIYVGHTPQVLDGITGMCLDSNNNNKINLVDYGGSKAFDLFDTNGKEKSDSRKSQVLEILNDGEVINILK